MAYYGIPSAGIALTAGSDNDQIGVIGHGATTLTAQTIFGGAGNDIINFGAAGLTATLTATFSGDTNISGGQLSATLTDPNSVFTTTGVATAIATGQYAQATGTNLVLTSVAAISTIDSAFIQANAGNDTIALGTSLTRVTATELRAGQGNDFIGFGTQLRAAGTFATANQNAAAFKDSTIVGGKGNDTIRLVGANTFTGVEFKAGAGNDHVNLQSGNYLSARIGLGDGNDILSGQMEEIDAASIEGGAGNDTIFINNIESAVVGGDALSAHAASTDGKDSIVLNGTMSASTIYGGGGNDTLQISAANIADSANYINLGEGADTINLSANGVILHSATVGMGKGNDLFTIADDDVDFKVRPSNWVPVTTQLSSPRVPPKTPLAPTLTQPPSTVVRVLTCCSTLLISWPQARSRRSLVSLTLPIQPLAVMTPLQLVVEPLLVVISSMCRREAWPIQLATANFTATNSLVTFTSTFSQDLTARVEALDASMAQGEVALFEDGNVGSKLAYLFVQGGTTDTVVQLGTAQITNFAASASLTISGTNSALINIQS